MKVSQVLDYMGVECIIRGDVDYNDQLVFSDLNIDLIGDDNITNAEFHAQAALCAAQLQIVDYGRALQDHIDAMAREKQYDNGFTLATYVNSSNDKWAKEAADFIAWRDSCWEYAYNIQIQVENGEIQPPSVEDFIANMPALIWS